MTTPKQGEEPTDEQLQRLMKAAADEVRSRADASDEALQAAIEREVARVKEQYLSRPPFKKEK